MKNKTKKYVVMLNGNFCMNTRATSPEKAINNARYRIYLEKKGWWDVPSAEEFDAVEV